jgi:hypothetical protein
MLKVKQFVDEPDFDRISTSVNHPLNRPEFRKLDRSLSSSWGCEPHPSGPQKLQDAANYIADTMIPALKRLRALYTVEGTGGFVNFIDLARGVNNPWCVIRGKTFVKWGKTLVNTMKKIDDAFDKGKKISVIRNYVKKAAFLEKFAEQLVKTADSLEEKCKVGLGRRQLP